MAFGNVEEFTLIFNPLPPLAAQVVKRSVAPTAQPLELLAESPLTHRTI